MRDWTPEELEKGKRWMNRALQARDLVLRERRQESLSQAKPPESKATTERENSAPSDPATQG